MRELIAINYSYSLEIYEFDGDYVGYKDMFGKWHRVKLYADAPRAYFRYGAHRVYLDDCLRAKI